MKAMSFVKADRPDRVRPRPDRHAYVLSSHQKERIASALALSLCGAGGRTGVDRDVGGRGLGDPLLRKTWLSIS